MLAKGDLEANRHGPGVRLPPGGFSPLIHDRVLEEYYIKIQITPLAL